MSDTEHLTRKELATYRDRSVEKFERERRGRHLLVCADCRRKLPLPSVDEFWAALLSDEERGQVPSTQLSKGAAVPVSFGNARFGFAWGVAALATIIGLSLLLWPNLFEGNKENRDLASALGADSENEIAGSAYLRPAAPIVHDGGPPGMKVVPGQIDDAQNQTRKQPEERRPERSKRVARETPGRDLPVKPPSRPELIISTVRGGSGSSEGCGDEALLTMDTAMSGETVQLRWRPVPDAVKYHLYVSDDEEILIDEYETERETVYTLKKPLDPSKTYRWKLVITLENGRTIVSDARKFTAEDSRSEQKVLKSQSRTQARCLTGN